jgi:hypothetical protein
MITPLKIAVQRIARRLARREAALNADPTRAELHAALVEDRNPLLGALRFLITRPTRPALLTVQAFLPQLERDLLKGKAADAPFFKFLVFEWIAGLDLDTTQTNAITFRAVFDQITDALSNAFNRAVMPTSLGTEGLRQLLATLRAQSFFSARTTQAGYLKELKKLIERNLADEYNGDIPQLRVEARALLRAFGYTPEKGFKGDAKRGIPPARPGSLQDLSSERRLNLIINTQAALMRGLGQKMRGLDRMDVMPYWELIRIAPRKTERDWPKRWKDAGGTLTAEGKMIAPKDSEIWDALGDSALFDDALDVDHPPFAFESGMGWAERFTDGNPKTASQKGDAKKAIPATRGPQAKDFIGGQATVDELRRELAEIEKTQPLTLDDVLNMK